MNTKLALNFMFSCLLWWVIIVFFYKYIKIFLIRLAKWIAKISNWYNHSSLQERTGTFELILIASSHVIFCLLLIHVFSLNLQVLGLFKINISSIIYGAVLGVGEMYLSSLLCLFAIRLMQTFQYQNAPNNIEGWSVLAKAGWIRHHFHTVNLIPIIPAYLVVLLQLASEEVIFRGVLFNLFLPYGFFAAFFISLILFAYMQIFLMPSIKSCIFPVIGAITMGVFHGYLYFKTGELVPLIIAHFSFFIIALA